jgi:ParB-like chromosome segregation protein Spo0J
MELEPRTTAPAHATGAVAFVPLSAIADDATFRLRDPGDVSALAASMGRLGHLVPVELRPLPGAAEEEPRFQVVAGFRRIAALRLLARDRVLARVHAALDDEDAWAIALSQALLGEPLQARELEVLRERLAAARIAPWAEELVDEALVRAPVDPEVRERFLAFVAGAPLAEPGEPSPDEAAAGGDASDEGFADDDAERGAAVDDDGEGEAVRDEAPATEASSAGREGPVEVTPDELAQDIALRLFEVNQDLGLAFDVWGDIPEEGRRMIVEQARYVAELYPLLGGRRR